MRVRSGRTTPSAALAALLVVAALVAAGGPFSLVPSPLVPPDHTPGDLLGRSVAVGQGVVFVGAPGSDGTGPSAADEGRIHVFARTDEGWSHQQAVAAAAPRPGADLGRSLGFANGTLAAGAPDEPDEASWGAVYLFQQNEGVWRQTARLIQDPNEPIELFFGSRIAIDGDRVHVGAGQWPSGFEGTAVYSYSHEGLPVGRVHADREANHFGAALASTEGLLAVGAPGGPARGQVFLFKNGALDHVWAGMRADDHFGAALALQDGTIFIGAPQDLGGAVHVFDVDERGRTATIRPPAGFETVGFGSELAIQVVDATLLISAPGDDETPGVVAAYGLASPHQLHWSIRGMPGEAMGRALAADGDAFVIGAPLNDTLGPRAGRAVVYAPAPDDACPDCDDADDGAAADTTATHTLTTTTDQGTATHDQAADENGSPMAASLLVAAALLLAAITLRRRT